MMFNNCLLIQQRSQDFFISGNFFYLDKTNEALQLERFHCKVVENFLKSG